MTKSGREEAVAVIVVVAVAGKGSGAGGGADGAGITGTLLPSAEITDVAGDGVVVELVNVAVVGVSRSLTAEGVVLLATTTVGGTEVEVSRWCSSEVLLLPLLLLLGTFDDDEEEDDSSSDGGVTMAGGSDGGEMVTDDSPTTKLVVEVFR